MSFSFSISLYRSHQFTTYRFFISIPEENRVPHLWWCLLPTHPSPMPNSGAIFTKHYWAHLLTHYIAVSLCTKKKMLRRIFVGRNCAVIHSSSQPGQGIIEKSGESNASEASPSTGDSDSRINKKIKKKNRAGMDSSMNAARAHSPPLVNRHRYRPESCGYHSQSMAVLVSRTHSYIAV